VSKLNIMAKYYLKNKLYVYLPIILVFMKNRLKSIPFKLPLLAWKNKSLVTIVAFLIFLCFFDKYNLRTQYKIYSTLLNMQDQKANYIHLIAEAKQDKFDLEQNYERFAREKYFMSRLDEDVFIIETKKIIKK
jgi:cell division protein DivIC